MLWIIGRAGQETSLCRRGIFILGIIDTFHSTKKKVVDALYLAIVIGTPADTDVLNNTEALEILDRIFILDKYGGRYTWESINQEHNLTITYMKLVNNFKIKAQEMQGSSFKSKEMYG